MLLRIHKEKLDLVLKGPHIVEIDLSESYPREEQNFTYKTEIFHPNFKIIYA